MAPMRRYLVTSPEPRMEMTPLLDVVFLLLTFFIFALVLMVRAEVLDITLPRLTGGTPAEPGAAITVALDANGRVYVDGQWVDRDGMVDSIRATQQEHEAEGITPRLFVAADEGGRSGDLIALLDVLARSGLGDFSVVGRPRPTASDGPPPEAPPQ
jgi:biopolymer transport protein ExbD